MILKRSGPAIAAATIAIVVSACAVNDDTQNRSGVSVVVTTTMLGDIARNIVGSDGTVDVLLPIGADAHDLVLSSAQVTAIYAADLVLLNGLGLEAAISDVLDGARDAGVNVIEVAESVRPVTLGERRPCLSDDARVCDPHVWLDPDRDAMIAEIVGSELSDVEPLIDWPSRASAYGAAMRESDIAITEILSVVADQDRLLVTNHDALGYFADRYGFEVVGSIFPGGGTLSEPSTADLADLVDLINERGIGAIFAETTESATLARAVAAEADHPVEVILLFVGSLGEPGSDADTLIGMLETNAVRIAEALS